MSRKNSTKGKGVKKLSKVSKKQKAIPKEVIKKTVENLHKSKVYPGTRVSNTDSALKLKWNYKLVSWNINGIRAAIKNKALDYIREESADVVGLQETKCSLSDIPGDANDLEGYKSFWNSAEKSGYAGTGVYSKIEPITIKYGIGIDKHDNEGRTVTVEYESFYFVTSYVPNSGRGLIRLSYRTKEWDVDFSNYLKNLDAKKPIIVCGDLNVAHSEIDLANPKTNTKTAGFTTEERDSFTKILKNVNLVDTFRHIYPERTGAYTFWSYMGNSREKNIGWRLDYFLISKRFLPKLVNQELRTGVMGSDHCPIVLYLNL